MYWLQLLATVAQALCKWPNFVYLNFGPKIFSTKFLLLVKSFYYLKIKIIALHKKSPKIVGYLKKSPKALKIAQMAQICPIRSHCKRVRYIMCNVSKAYPAKLLARRRSGFEAISSRQTSRIRSRRSRNRAESFRFSSATRSARRPPTF